MINGRDEMLTSVNKELTFLDSMRESAQETISVQKKLIEVNETKLREADEMYARFMQRTEMCEKLRDGLNDFQAGLDALSESKGVPR